MGAVSVSFRFELHPIRTPANVKFLDLLSDQNAYSDFSAVHRHDYFAAMLVPVLVFVYLSCVASQLDLFCGCCFPEIYARPICRFIFVSTAYYVQK